jgi:conjugal transfer/entry exclusion protein
MLRTSEAAITEFDPSMCAQAGSEALSKYIAARGRLPAMASATVPEQIDQALQRLHASVAGCEGLLTRLQAATASMEEV